MSVLLVILCVLALAGAAFALLPLRSSGARIALKSERDELQDELNAALSQIADLERMRADGELDAAEFERLKTLDETRAAKILARLDALPTSETSNPQPSTTSRSRLPGALIGLVATVAVLGGLSALAVPSLQRLALRDGEAKLYDDSNKLLALENQVIAQANTDGKPQLATLLEYGSLAWELQDWERAAQAYSAVLRADPANIVAVSRYGQLLFFAGQNDQAITLLRVAGKFNDPEALLTLGNLLFSSKNDPKGALEVWQQYQRVTGSKAQPRVIELIAAAKKRLGTTDPGAQTFATNCAGCHGANGQGIAGSGPNLITSSRARDAAFVRKQLQNGSANKKMPAFPQIKGQELEALVRYVTGLKP
jgi:mono/diheme cytochrome c family protein